MPGLFIPYHIVIGLVPSRWYPRKEEWRSLKIVKMSWSRNEPSQGGECVSITESSTRLQRKTTSHCSSLMKCWSGWRSILSSVSLMGIRGIIRFPSTPMIKARPHSLAYMERMCTDGCRSGCAMHPHRSNGAWCLFSQTWLKRSWKSSWMIFRSMGKLSIIVLWI